MPAERDLPFFHYLISCAGEVPSVSYVVSSQGRYFCSYMFVLSASEVQGEDARELGGGPL